MPMSIDVDLKCDADPCAERTKMTFTRDVGGEFVFRDTDLPYGWRTRRSGNDQLVLCPSHTYLAPS